MASYTQMSEEGTEEDTEEDTEENIKDIKNKRVNLLKSLERDRDADSAPLAHKSTPSHKAADLEQNATIVKEQSEADKLKLSLTKLESTSVSMIEDLFTKASSGPFGSGMN